MEPPTAEPESDRARQWTSYGLEEALKLIGVVKAESAQPPKGEAEQTAGEEEEYG